MSKRFGRPFKVRSGAKWARWRNFRERNTALEKPEPVKIIMQGGQYLTEVAPAPTVEEVFAAYAKTNAGNDHGAATTLEELLEIGRLATPKGGDPPW